VGVRKLIYIYNSLQQWVFSRDTLLEGCKEIAQNENVGRVQTVICCS